MQSAIISHCKAIKAKPIITTDHNLIYQKEDKLFICHYEGNNFKCGVEIKDMDKLCNGIMKYLGGTNERA